MSKTAPFSVLEGRLYQIPLSEAIAADVELSGLGTTKTGLCPFHNDHHKGSFMVNDQKGYWKCFACGEGGKGPATFIKKLYGVDYEDAVRMLAERLHLTEGAGPAAITPRPRIIRRPTNNTKLEPIALDQVYRIFIDCAGPMPKSMIEMLKTARFVRDEELHHFFPAPEFSPTFMEQFCGKLREVGLDPETVLCHTPGFYYEARNKRIRFQKMQPNTLGIKCFDSWGRIAGIQFRRETEDHKKRYVWFSSGFADGTYGCSNGTANSHVVDVLPGSNGKLVCTEGKFKALALNRERYTVLNMHGITSWDAEKVAKYARIKKFDSILLCYDADILRNQSVAEAALKFTAAFSHFQYLTWNEQEGKGYDDLVNQGGHAEIVDGPDFNQMLRTRFSISA